MRFSTDWNQQKVSFFISSISHCYACKTGKARRDGFLGFHCEVWNLVSTLNVDLLSVSLLFESCCCCQHIIVHTTAKIALSPLFPPCTSIANHVYSTSSLPHAVGFQPSLHKHLLHCRSFTIPFLPTVTIQKQIVNSSWRKGEPRDHLCLCTIKTIEDWDLRVSNEDHNYHWSLSAWL